MWTVTGTTAKASLHSIITGRRAALARFDRERRQIFGVARVRKTGGVEDVLGNRVGARRPRPFRCRRAPRRRRSRRSFRPHSLHPAGPGSPNPGRDRITGQRPPEQAPPRRSTTGLDGHPPAEPAAPAPGTRGRSGTAKAGRPRASALHQALSVISGPIPPGRPASARERAGPAHRAAMPILAGRRPEILPVVQRSRASSGRADHHGRVSLLRAGHDGVGIERVA
jgi:hypothetical protein